MRKLMVSVMMTAGATTLFSGAKAFAAQGEQMTVVLQVSDYAHLSPADLKGAEDEATRIYMTADIKLVWVNPGEAASEEYADALHLNVLLLDRDESAPLPIHVQGRQKLLGSPSVSGGAMAMKVERALDTVPHTGAAGSR